jgi:hypothetical protein
MKMAEFVAPGFINFPSSSADSCNGTVFFEPGMYFAQIADE